ncbi:MAG: autotransporter outer membrane beta-barrel domain-containing protein [Rhizobiaceae bacterium]|nr:autotransporter outer membrane beta-barrel domain-containing protein [Rhizobiaceae bacterium]
MDENRPGDRAAIAILANETSGKVSLNFWGDIQAVEGAYAKGVSVEAAEAVIEYVGDIQTYGQSNQGNHGISLTGSAEVTRENRLLHVDHQGNISIDGGGGRGIAVLGSDANHVLIQHAGNIEVNNFSGVGIWGSTGGGFNTHGGNIRIENRGNMTVEATHFSVGIVASGYLEGVDSIAVLQVGDITATSTQAGDSYGIRANRSRAEGGEVEVFFTGTMNIQGKTTGGGIRLFTQDNRSSLSATLGEAATGLDGNQKTGAHITATAGSGGAIGVEFEDGDTNTLNTYNEVTISGGTFDVFGGERNETINNYGTLTMLGDTDLGEGINAFNNQGVFNSGLTLDVGADTNLFTNSGTVSIFGDDNMNRTVLTGSWDGQPNSRLRIEAVLNDGVSDVTDVLAVSGDTSGTTLVFVYNQGGEGGETGNGTTDGIKITEIGGQSNGVFQLGHQVFAGLAEYELVKADGKDWYLQTILVEDDPGEIDDPEEIDDPVEIDDPEEIGDPEENLNSINDSAISSVQIPRSLHSFGTALTGSRKDRLSSGSGEATYGLALDGAKIPGSWASIVGGRGDADGTVSDGIVRGGVFGADTSHEENFWALQGGFTAFTADDRLTGSVFFHYGGIDIDHTNKTRNRSAGSTDMTAWGGGVSVTWLDPRGFYVDGVMTATAYDIDMLDSNDDESSTDARAQTVSGEIGYQLAPIREITVTPQLQLTYQNLWIKSYTDAGGNRIAYDDEDSLEVRVGSAFDLAINDSVSLYSQLNILHQLLDAPSVAFGSDSVPVSMDWDDTSYEARLGVRLRPQGAPYSGYVEAKYQAPFDGDSDTESWSATGGLAYRF